MVQPQGPDIVNGIAGQDGLIGSNNSSVGWINRRAESDLGEISVDESLDGGIQKPGRDGNESERARGVTWVGVGDCIGRNFCWGQSNTCRPCWLERVSGIFHRRKVA